jgi:hypothetical protein
MPSNASYRQSWRLRGLMDEYLVVRGVEVQSAEAHSRVPGSAAMLHLRRWRGDSQAERTLLELHEALGGVARSGVSGHERRSYLERLWEDLESAFESGRLALLKVPRPVFISTLPEKAKEEDWKNESEPTSWVGLQLEDEEGNPVAGQRVRIKLPDGTARERVSDEKGRIRLDGIPVGNCQVEFPGVDGNEWRAA